MVQHLRLSSRFSVTCVGLAFALTSFTMAVTAPAAHATDLVQITTCGQSVNADAILMKNLTCADDGLAITGDGVTVDLDGHVIRSTTGTGRGIVLDGPRGSTATVRGPGNVKGFQTGIDALEYLGFPPQPASPYRHHLIVDGVRLLDNMSGIQVLDSLTDVTASTIRGTNGIGTPGGPSSTASAGVVNLDSSSVKSTGAALQSSLGGEMYVRHSQVSGGTIYQGSNTHVGVADSTLKEVRIYAVDGFIGIERSLMVDTSVSLVVTGGSFNDNVIRSTRGGVAFDDGSGGYATSFEGNRFSGWDNAIQIASSSSRVDITNNRFDHNVTGILTQCSSGAIRSNTLRSNTGDAIVLGCGQWAVGGNRMFSNGGSGINATGLVQVTDEGGNIARGNAEPQCVGVVCLSR